MAPRIPKAPKNALSFKRKLLKWFRQHGRNLPWRRTRDPYRIVVSEFMLQQTQVTRVKEYYPQFLDCFPTLYDLARARPRQVREVWEGLGYYRRAHNLHRLAKTVVEQHDGKIPDDPAELERLPGVGRYTAGAVASFAYQRRAAAVDTNVARVVSRAFRPRLASRTRQSGREAEWQHSAASHALWDLAERILPKNRRAAWEFNQALMDLGAQYCIARRPRCDVCPVQQACRTGRRTMT